MKYRALLLSMALLITASTLHATTATNGFDKEKIARMTEEEKNARVSTIKSRVEEIRDMDRSNLSRAERKELRRELKDLNKEARAIGRGGVYISLGGILLIILILILIL
jgi:flagellar motility protein MotE (MotC chaperone)